MKLIVTLNTDAPTIKELIKNAQGDKPKVLVGLVGDKILPAILRNAEQPFPGDHFFWDTGNGRGPNEVECMTWEVIQGREESLEPVIDGQFCVVDPAALAKVKPKDAEPSSMLARLINFLFSGGFN